MKTILQKLNLDPKNMIERAKVHYLKENDNDVKLIVTTEDSTKILLELVKTESGVMKVTVGDSNKTDVVSSDHEHQITDIIGLETRLVNIESQIAGSSNTTTTQPW